ncbi:hypothetical protein GF420_01125 [candidate division GN15 bacterium]|nr:hypothetical protein [candidate division GN15 bacterium]
MTDKEKQQESKKPSGGKDASGGPVKPIDENQRFRYIGFEVYPGKPKDLFKSDAERDLLVKRLAERRERGEIIREHNTLLEERVSWGERIVLAIACLIVLGSLFLPWYSAYTEVIETPPASEQAVVTDAPEGVTMIDSLADTVVVPDSATAAAVADPDTTVTEPDTAAAGAAAAGGDDGEEIIHGGIARQKVHKETETVSWFGAIFSLGSFAGYVFSSGMLAISAILMILYMLLAIVLPLFTLYLLFGSKARGDDLALQLKRALKLNWVPVILFIVVGILSFFGGSYSFDAASLYDSLGDSYGIMAFANALSWGVFVSLAMFIMVAVKSSEI